MYYGAKDAVRRILGMEAQSDVLREKEFWALEDISFELKRGECLGVIGPNGAGKSTLLKLLNGIISPDKGRLMTRGRVGALIQVGAGFHPNLTGRENIYVNGQILGMDKAFIDNKFDAIVDFADIGDFLDTPVKFYSSGMFVRLGFAVAAHMEPDVLLVDEVLAVGDIGFRAKCYNVIYEFQKQASIIIVSHNMYQVARTSTQAMHLRGGSIHIHSSDVNAVIEECNKNFSSQETIVLSEPGVAADKFRINDKDLDSSHVVRYGESFCLSFDFFAPDEYEYIEVSISLISSEQQVVSNCNSVANGKFMRNMGRKMRISASIPQLLLGLRCVEIGLTVRDVATNKILFWQKPLTNLHIQAENSLVISPAAYLADWVVSS